MFRERFVEAAQKSQVSGEASGLPRALRSTGTEVRTGHPEHTRTLTTGPTPKHPQGAQLQVESDNRLGSPGAVTADTMRSHWPQPFPLAPDKLGRKRLSVSQGKQKIFQMGYIIEYFKPGV